MDRRSFIRSMFALGGAVAVGVALTPSRSEASPLLDSLKDLDRSGMPLTPDADLPAEGAQEVQNRRGWRRRGWRGRRRVRRCVIRRNRWGRRVRGCTWR